MVYWRHGNVDVLFYPAHRVRLSSDAPHSYKIGTIVPLGELGKVGKVGNPDAQNRAFQLCADLALVNPISRTGYAIFSPTHRLYTRGTWCFPNPKSGFVFALAT